jgi:hypothetical protein
VTPPGDAPRESPGTVTYPTTTPASLRAHLKDLVKHTLQLDTVVADFDEGVAAGLFFLLRDFGSNRREFGAEGLRARSRRVGDDPPSCSRTCWSWTWARGLPT